MVSAQQETNSLFLKSDTDRETTPSEPSECIAPQFIPKRPRQKVQLLTFSACFFDKDIEMG